MHGTGRKEGRAAPGSICADLDLPVSCLFMGWRRKPWRYRVLELPGGMHAHYFLQRHDADWPRPASTLVSLQNIARRVVEDYARHVGGTPSSVLKIGAGRDLAVPLALRQLGVAKVIASDVSRLARLRPDPACGAAIPHGLCHAGKPDHLERFGVATGRRTTSLIVIRRSLLLLERGARAHPAGPACAVARGTAGDFVGITDAFDRLQRPLCPFGQSSLAVQFPEIRRRGVAPVQQWLAIRQPASAQRLCQAVPRGRVRDP